MRELTLKYDGECRKCGATLKAGERGHYEKRVGVFCLPCGPTDPEEIRAYRQEGADRKADRLEEWASKRKAKAEAVFEANSRFTSDIAFNTQPGHIPFRARIIAQEDRQFESLRTAERFERKAKSLRNVWVAGDADRERQEKREAADQQFSRGDRIFTHLYGTGEIIRVNQKTYGVRFDRGFTQKVDKSWAIPA